MTATGLWYEKAIKDLISLQDSDQNILAMVLFGSAAHSPNDLDKWSDVDIFLVVDDESIDQYYPDLDWLHQLGSIFTHDHSQNIYYKTSRIVFTDLRRMDIAISTSSSLAMIDKWPNNPFRSGFTILSSKDKWIDEALEKMVEKPQPKFASTDDFHQMVDKFWFKGTLAVYKVARNDLLIALHLALDMVQECCVLGMMLRDRAEGITFHKTGGVGNEYVRQISSSEQPYTSTGILDMIENCSKTFDDLASDWSEDYGDKRYPLIDMINLAREDVGRAS